MLIVRKCVEVSAKVEVSANATKHVIKKSKSQDIPAHW